MGRPWLRLGYPRMMSFDFFVCFCFDFISFVFRYEDGEQREKSKNKVVNEKHNRTIHNLISVIEALQKEITIHKILTDEIQVETGLLIKQAKEAGVQTGAALEHNLSVLRGRHTSLLSRDEDNLSSHSLFTLIEQLHQRVEQHEQDEDEEEGERVRVFSFAVSGGDIRVALCAPCVWRKRGRSYSTLGVSITLGLVLSYAY